MKNIYLIMAVNAVKAAMSVANPLGSIEKTKVQANAADPNTLNLPSGFADSRIRNWEQPPSADKYCSLAGYGYGVLRHMIAMRMICYG